MREQMRKYLFFLRTRVLLPKWSRLPHPRQRDSPQRLLSTSLTAASAAPSSSWQFWPPCRGAFGVSLSFFSFSFQVPVLTALVFSVLARVRLLLTSLVHRILYSAGSLCGLTEGRSVRSYPLLHFFPLSVVLQNMTKRLDVQQPANRKAGRKEVKPPFPSGKKYQLNFEHCCLR